MSESDQQLFESVPNVSTADPRVVAELARALARPPEVRLIHATSDPRHGRTVFTLLGRQAPLSDALVALAQRCNELIDLREHDGLHPRVGHLDVVPIIALGAGRGPQDAAPIARQLMKRLVEEAGLCCAPYDAAAREWTSLPDLRRGGPARLLRRIEAEEVEALRPVPDDEEKRAARGVTCVGARKILVAFNVELLTGELRAARRIADRLRESTGGLPAVRALGLKLADDRVQVSMNLIDHERTDVATAHDWVKRLAADEGAELGPSELIGCVPRAAWPVGLGERIDEPEVRGEQEERRILDSWLPGGSLESDPGLEPEEAEGTSQAETGRSSEPAAPKVDRLRLLDLGLDESRRELESLMTELGERSYRASQVLRGLWQGRRRSFAEMTDLSKELRTRLAERVSLGLLEVAERQESSDGTIKYLWRCSDGSEVESVSIPTERRTTFCVSSQVGCTLKCKFCATGYLGFGRNLSAGEILDQALAMLADQGSSSESLNVVFMGMGEPGHNLDAVLQAARILNDPAGLNVGARRITISTSGVPAAIEALAQEPTQFRLALSLHAANQETRLRLMNIAEKHPLDELHRHCTAYRDATRRRITLEYCLIPGVTDGAQAARELAEWSADLPSKVNLIPYNPVPEYRTAAADAETCARFRQQVLDAGYRGEVTVREPRGRDIEAACGMLHRHRSASAESPA